MQNNTCAAHEEFRTTILTAVGGIRDVLQTELRALREDLSRRLDESASDRADLHDQYTAVSGRVENLTGRLNGLHRRDGETDAHPHSRDEDNSLLDKIKANWVLVLVVSLAALAGERVLTAAKEILVAMVQVNP